MGLAFYIRRRNNKAKTVSETSKKVEEVKPVIVPETEPVVESVKEEVKHAGKKGKKSSEVKSEGPVREEITKPSTENEVKVEE